MSILHGKHIILRALEPEDLNLLYTWENDTVIWSLGNTHKPYSKDTLKKYLETAHLDIFESRQVRFAICLKGNEKKPVGLIDLYEFDPLHQRAGVGILIGEKDLRGKGFGREALDILCQYAFSILHMHQLFCCIPASNQRSIKLFTKAGFTNTGRRTEWLKSDVGWEDELFYQLSSAIWSSKWA